MVEVIDQVVSVAESFLMMINNNDIKKELSNQVACDIKANIEWMTN